jgi:CxxC motif-containing protein (DUF1111 family)
MFIGLAATPLPKAAPTVRRYFGEPLPGMSPIQAASFDRGARLFAKDWGGVADGVADAPSCVSCHSVPTPAGSGMSERALVTVDSSAIPGDRREIVQRDDPGHMVGELRRTPALFGIGLLVSVASSQNVGPFRLGAHNRQASLRGFVSSAFATELGVSTPDECSRLSVQTPYPKRCNSRVTNTDVDDVVAYITFLAPPAPPSRQRAETVGLFRSLGCSACHVETLTLGPQAPLKLSGYTIFPYSDLRAHDIGTSSRGPIRTTPLWGLNSYGPPYLHDASAGDIESAILAHKVEAEQSRTQFSNLSGAKRAELIDYLRSF